MIYAFLKKIVLEQLFISSEKLSEKLILISCNEAVDKLFQQSSADELMEMMSTPLLSAYCLFCLGKKQIFSVFTADPFGSFSEAVDKLFQQLWFKNA